MGAGSMTGGVEDRPAGGIVLRGPLRTYVTSYRAAVGLYFFKVNFE
jgi:hypothetical protein